MILLSTQQKNPGNLTVPGYLTFGHNVPCGTQYILISDYSMIVATRPDPTVRPPSRYQNGVLQRLNGYFPFILCEKIRIFRCVRVVFGDFVIMVLSLDILISFYHSHLFFVLHMQHIDWIGFKFFFIC